MSRLVFFIFLISLIPVAAADEHPAASPDPLLVFDLGQIAVAGKADQPVTVAATTVTAEQFDQKMDQSVTEAVAQVPGMIVTVGSKNEPQIMLRGMNQQRTLILYDGVAMASGYYGDLDASELPLENLAEIEVIRGNAPVIYGPNAMAGVVSLVSAKPGNRPNLRILTTADDEGNYTGRATHGARRGAFYYQLSAGTRQSDGWALSSDYESVYDSRGDLLEDGDIRENSGFSQWSGGLKVGADGDRGEWSFSANTQTAEKDIPPTTSPDAKVSYRKFSEWSKTTAMAAGRLQASSAVEIRTNVYYHKYDNVLDDYKDSTYRELRWSSSYDDYSVGGLVRASWTLAPRWTARFASTALIDNHRSQADRQSPWEEYEARTYAVMTEGEFNATAGLAATLGASWEVFDFASVEGVTMDRRALANRTPDIAAPAFSLNLRYDLSSAQRLSAGLTRRNRFPTMHQLFGNMEDYAPEDIGTLDPEHANEYSAGYRYQFDSASEAGASVYYYSVDGLIERPNRDAMYANIDEAEFSGAELWGSYGAAAGPQARLSYAFMNATGTYASGKERDLPRVPEQMLHLTAGYAFAFGTTLEGGMVHRSEAVEYDASDNPLAVPAYTLFDLSVRHQFAGGLGLMVQGSNLTDEDYYQEVGYPLAGRTVKLGISYSL